MKIVYVIGSESTGKTSLCNALSQYFKGGLVNEYARLYFEKNSHDNYSLQDVERIAFGQMRAIDYSIWLNEHVYTFVDTCMIDIHVWMKIKFEATRDWLKEHTLNYKNALYLLCDIDTPWKADPLRENPHKRQLLHNEFLHTLQQWNIKHTLINGSENQRLSMAISAIENFFESK